MLMHLRELALVPVQLNELPFARDPTRPILGLSGRQEVALLALAGISRVAATERRQLPVAQLPDARHRGVQEGAVVRGHDQAAVAPAEGFLEPLESPQVKMVRGLIQQQQLRVGEEQPGQRGAGLLAAR